MKNPNVMSPDPFPHEGVGSGDDTTATHVNVQCTCISSVSSTTSFSLLTLHTLSTFLHCPYNAFVMDTLQNTCIYILCIYTTYYTSCMLAGGYARVDRDHHIIT